MYSLLTHLLWEQLLPFSVRTCFNLVQFTWSNAFCQSMKQAQNSSFFQEFWYYSRHPNCIPSSFSFPKFKLISKYILNFIFKPSCKYPHYFCCMCNEADCVMIAAFCSFWLFSKAVFITSMKSLGQSLVSYMCQLFETIFSQQFEYIPRYVIISSLCIFHLLDSFFHLPAWNIRAYLICICFLLIFSFWVFMSTSSIVDPCTIVVPNFLYLSLIHYYILLRVFDANVLNSMIFFPARFLCFHVHKVQFFEIPCSCHICSQDIPSWLYSFI